MNFWKDEYAKIESLPLDNFNKSVNFQDLLAEYSKYKQKILEINSKFIIYLASKIKFLNFFQPINIFLLDHKKNYEFSLFDGFKETKNDLFSINLQLEHILDKNNFNSRILFGNNNYATLQAPATGESFNLQMGTLTIDVFTPIGVGAGANFTIAERIKDKFDRAKFSSIIFDPSQGPATIRPAEQESFFQTQLSATFEAYLD